MRSVLVARGATAAELPQFEYSWGVGVEAVKIFLYHPITSRTNPSFILHLSASIPCFPSTFSPPTALEFFFLFFPLSIFILSIVSLLPSATRHVSVLAPPHASLVFLGNPCLSMSFPGVSFPHLRIFPFLLSLQRSPLFHSRSLSLTRALPFPRSSSAILARRFRH